MSRLRSLIAVVLIALGGSALAYDGFTVGVQAQGEYAGVGTGLYAVLPLVVLGDDATGTLSVRFDAAASSLAYFGAGAMFSTRGDALVKPFVGVGAGAALWGGPPLRISMQWLLGARIRLGHSNFHAVAQAQLRLGSESSALPGFALGLEYKF